MALSNPFHLDAGECLTLFNALAPWRRSARLRPWDEEDDSEGPLVDLSQAQACLNLEQRPERPNRPTCVGSSWAHC